MRRLPPVFLSLALIIALAPSAHAGVPSAANSVVDPCLNVCPLGDIAFHVTVRDLASNPVANSHVTIDVCQVPSVNVCFQGACNQLASGFTDASGTLVLHPQGGGVTPAPFVQMASIRADGVLVASRVVGSPDQDGDLVVTAADLALGAAALGTNNPTMDFDCNLAATGVIQQADLDIQATHLGHNCDGPTGAHAKTWGGMKILYR
jgi:hypothetical protein